METQSNLHTHVTVTAGTTIVLRGKRKERKESHRALFDYCTDKSAQPWEMKEGESVGGSERRENFRHVYSSRGDTFLVNHLIIVAPQEAQSLRYQGMSHLGNHFYSSIF